MFGGEAIADVVSQMLVLAEILRRSFKPGCHDVPARPTAADVVEGREVAREVEGFGVGDRHVGDEADAIGEPGERRQDGERLEAVQVVRARAFVDR